jgi:hypothetical protein
MQDAALLVVEKLPEAHFEHIWSAVALPAVETYVPAPHWVHPTHAVAGLPSLSQVPAAQGTSGAVPPAQ